MRFFFSKLIKRDPSGERGTQAKRILKIEQKKTSRTPRGKTAQGKDTSFLKGGLKGFLGS